MSEGNGQIYGLMAKVMAEVGAVEKGRRNEQQRYNFRGIDDVYNALHQVLAANGVFFLPEVLDHDAREVAVGKDKNIWCSRTAKIRFTFFAPDGSHVEAVTLGEGMDPGDKSANKAQSAAAKYALIQAFCIPTEEMIDSETENPPPRQQKQAPAPKGKRALSEQVAEMKSLLNVVRLPDGTTDKWFAKAGVDAWEDMPPDVLERCIKYTKARLPQIAAS